MRLVLMGGDVVAPSTERNDRRAERPVEAARRKRLRQRPIKNNLSLKQTIDNVAAEESSQKRGARRFPIWESGGSSSHHDRDETRQEIACRTGRLYRDRSVARRF